MATNQTANYQLNQWEPTDQVLRTDFNADNAKLDAAIAELESGKADQSALSALSSTVTSLSLNLTKLTFGSYVGNDAASRTISLGFTPKAVLVFTSFGAVYDGLEYASCHYGGLASTGRPIQSKASEKMVLQVASNGFTVAYESSASGDRILTNETGVTYYYIAFT